MNVTQACLKPHSAVVLLPRRYLARRVSKRKMPVPKTERRLNITILGTPNAGKSTLLNCLIKQRVAACTQKRHTTRNKILGVYNYRNIQLAFYDTPGFVSLSDSFKTDTKILRKLAVEATTQADVVLIVVDAARNLTPEVKDTFAEMAKIGLDQSKIEIILVLNKVDLVTQKYELLDTTRSLVSLINGVKLGPEKAELAVLDTTTFMISASENDGVIDLKNYLLSLAPIRSWEISRESGPTDMSNEERVEEMILEMMMVHTHDEIPYVAGINCTSISDLTASRLRIDVDILVNSVSQQRIVVGAQGRTLVKIRQDAVVALEQLLEKQVILYMWVKIRNQKVVDDDTATAFGKET